MFRHSNYGRQPSAALGEAQSRGQTTPSSSGFSMPGLGGRRRVHRSSLGGVGAMIASSQAGVGSDMIQSGYGDDDGFGSSGVGGREFSAPHDSPAYDAMVQRGNPALPLYLNDIGEQQSAPSSERKTTSETSVKVPRCFYDLYLRLFESVSAPGEGACNLHAFVHTMESEDDETLYLVLNDPLLVSLAKSQPRRLIKSYPAVPEFVTFNELINRLQRETRLDFSDVHGQKKFYGSRSSWADMQAAGREFYRRFLAFNTKDFAELEDSSIGMAAGRGQKSERDAPQSFKPRFSTPAVPKQSRGVVDLTSNEEETKAAPTFSASLPPPSSSGSAFSLRPGLHVHQSESGQGGMGAVQGTLSPEEKYKQATHRVDELMLKREAAEAAARAKENAQVIDLVSDDEEEGDGMDLQKEEHVETHGLSLLSSPALEEAGISSDLLIAERFKALSTADATRVETVLSGPQTQEVVKDKFNIDMTRNKIACLRPRTWLNDEVINFYMCMLKERDDALCAKNPQRRHSHFFNSFFINKLLQIDGKEEYDYKGVRRWSKKFDAFSLDKVFAPVNISNSHWAMLIIYIQKKEIHYNDSMSGSGSRFLHAARRWVVDEGKDKKGLDIDSTEWRLVSGSRAVPQQENGFDCGVFTIINADFASDDLPYRYTQGHMPYFRTKICNDILKGSLLDYSI